VELRLGTSLAKASRTRGAGAEPRPTFATIASARGCGRFLDMPNIQQQKKRVRLAAEQRIQNLRYRSTAKTLAKRLRDAVDSGNTAEAAEEHKKLISWLDRSAARGAIHKNTAARRKSQADRLVSGKPS
jgi:small subunit ribosomal protein S20